MRRYTTTLLHDSFVKTFESCPLTHGLPHDIIILESEVFPMKIRKVMFGYLEFDNGMTINSFTSYDDENANNYADFTQLLDTVAMDIDFDTDLVFVKF